MAKRGAARSGGRKRTSRASTKRPSTRRAGATTGEAEQSDRKLDPQLEFLRDTGIGDLSDARSAERFGIERAAPRQSPEVEVLVQFRGEVSELESAGLTVRSVAGDVVTGVVSLDQVDDLAAVGGVERIESARQMYGELDLSLVECRANLVHTGPPGRRGSGVIVGVVDSGIDYTHQCFRKSDGTSRILFIWDQGLTPQAGEVSPAGFGYGVEYSKAQIDAALATANPFASVRHRDVSPMHGTHVAGIAAGDGSPAGQGRPAFTFVGVAPEADIIVVANRSSGTEGLGTSANTLDGVNYVYQRAGTLGKAAAVNMSLGDNLGPHDGTSLLERGLDNLLGAPRRAFVKSAGNAGADDIHAQGVVGTGATVDVSFNIGPGDNSPEQMDLWYEGADTFRVSIVNPAGNATGVVNVGTASNFTLAGGNQVRIDHRNNDPFNGDKRIFMTLTRGTAATIMAGNWRIRLVSVASPSGGRFDAWIQRGLQIARFLAPHVNNAMTISTPGTAAEVITAASYITRGSGVGSLSTFSSRGPTRDGRRAPTIAAPGQAIFSAFGHSTGDAYQSMSGTSMAAPHVTGAIALMFQKNKERTQEQIRQCLESTARSDAQTGPVPNTAWGAGKMDVNGAVDCVPTPRSVATLTCPSAVTICPSTTTRCPSVTVACISVPVTNCPSAVVVCPSVTVICASAAACPSVPVQTCPVPSAVVACPSIVCPSPICGPGIPGGPGGPIIPGGPGGPVVTPVGPGGPGGGGIAAPQETSQLPAAGYFEYDESSFDRG
jgi:subtilisin family serine protease